jgi:hypothetical protein
MYKKIHESEYGDSPHNYHVTQHDDTLDVQLTYPPWKDSDNPGKRKVRFVTFDQEAVRASDGIRIHYDYERDGYVIEQPRPRLVGTAKKNSYEEATDWIEVGFFGAWAASLRTADDGSPTAEEYARADYEHSMLKGKR